MNKALLYVRVSSKEQELGYSLDAQERLGKEYAQKKNLNIVKSWKTWESAWHEERESFNQVMDYVTKHSDIKHVIFDITDRMTRNDPDKNKMWTLINKHGKTIHFSRTNRVLDHNATPEDIFMMDIEVAVAKKQSNDISRKTRMGMQEKAEQGYWPSIAPLGFNNNKLTGMIDPDEQRAPFMIRMFELAATGTYSQSMLSEQFYREGLRNRKGGKCGKSSIQHFLTNPIYYGPFLWKGKMYYNYKHTPLISKALFDKVQAVLGGKHHARPVRSFPFNNLMRCDICGCAIVGEIKKGRYVYYHCTQKKGKHLDVHYIRQEKVSDIFEPIVKGATLDDETVDLLKGILRADDRKSNEYRETRLSVLKVEYEKANNRLSRLLDAKFDNEITEQTFIAKEAEYQAKLLELKVGIDDLSRTNPNFYDDGCSLLELSKLMYPLYVAANFEEKVKILRLLGSNFRLNALTAIPTYRKPFGIFAKGLVCSEWLPRVGSNHGQAR